MNNYRAMALRTVNEDEYYGVDFIKNHIYSAKIDNNIVSVQTENGSDVIYDIKEFNENFILFSENGLYSSFINDKEKMNDFTLLSKEEFLNSYSYLTEKEYDMTMIQTIR